MKKSFTLFLLALFCVCGYAQTIDPVLLEEMGQRRGDEKIKVFVIMRQQYDQQQLNRSAAYFTTRFERREFVVNELKQFAEASQCDLRHSLAEMQRNELVSEPQVLWIANAIFFEATRDAILSLADRNDIMVIGFNEERNWLPDGEEAQPTDPTREITSNVTQVNADQVWSLGYTGQGVVVAVIDTGVNYNHLDLADHLWDGGPEFPYHGYDVYNNDNNPMDDHGHGTHCAGTVCGDGTAGSQTGMAPDATLMCVKCLDEGGYCYDTDIINAMQWAVDHGCDVISMSLGGHGHSGAEQTLLRNTCVNVLTAGVIAAIAAGNEGDELDEHPIPDNVGLPGGCPPPYLDPEQEQNPGGLSCSVCVGAVDSNDEAAYFTSRGPRDWSESDYADYPYTPGSLTEFGLIRPDVCAPGVYIKSASYSSNNGYTTKSGTSMATPCVAGCMALMLSKNISLTPAEICKILEETALPLADGKSNIYGYGRVDALAAINAVELVHLTLVSFEVDDIQGNSDGKLNAGEAVTLNLTLMNDSDMALDGVTMTLSTDSEFVTITNGIATLPYFDVGQTQTVEDIFAFTLSDEAPINKTIRFSANAFVDGVFIGGVRFNAVVYGYILKFDEVTILNDNNGNELLEAGETADLHIIISNIGNDQASSIVGILATTYSHLTINEVTGTFGNIQADEQVYANFNVTLSDNAPDLYVIDFTIDLVDDNEKHTNLNFVLSKGMIIFADSSVKSICLAHWDTNGDGGLSYAEAASITNLGSYFQSNSEITSFDELQYFIGLSSIQSYTFNNCTNLTSIELPNSVTSIGMRSFYNCTKLTSIELPNSLTTIGYQAFLNCSGLTSLTLPDSVTLISTSAFKGCSGLTSLTLPNSVTSIGNSAFESCYGLNAVFYTGDIHQWCDIQFNNYYSNPLHVANNLFVDNELVTDLVIPETVTEIKDHAFCGATCLTSLTLPNSVTSIGSRAFQNCSGFTGNLAIPNSVTTIGESAFSGCSGFTGNLTIPDSVTMVNWGAFYGCSGFTGLLTIPNSLTMIAGSTFDGCTGLTGLTIPNTITSIGDWAFPGCSGFTGSLTIPNSVTSIGEYAFFDCSGFTGLLTIPSSVTSIGKDAFENCRGFIGDLIIPNSVTSISRNTFEGCTGFTGSLTIPNSVTAIDGEAFRNCRGFIGSLIIPNSVITIGTGAFQDCSGFTNLIIGNSVTTISVATFCSCSGLGSITVLTSDPPTLGSSWYHPVFDYVDKSIPVYVPCGSLAAYQSAAGWNEFINIQEMHCPTEVHFTTPGNWSEPSNWSEGALPFQNDIVFIDAPCQLDTDAEVADLTISDGQSLTLQAGKTLTVTGTLIDSVVSALVIKDGAQLVNASANVAATMEKDITAYNNSNPDGWYTIASPMNEMTVAGSNFLTPSYDLYRFNETCLNHKEWENYKANLADFTTFENGRGYLYANGNAFSPTFTGTLNASAVTVPLTCTERPNDQFSGFNLIGNPFPHEIYKGEGGAIDNANLASGYYTLTNEGTWEVHSFDDAIQPGQGILVKATAPTNLTIAKSNEEAYSESGGAKMGTALLRISVESDDGKDRAYVYFGQGVGLDKVENFGQNAPSLAIRAGNQDFAIAHFDKKSDVIELVFTTPNSGDATLKVNAINSDFDSLHLFDSSTGTDIDLLQQPSYTFSASAQAGERLFRLLYKQSEK
ncbi:MAG: leucine-rich repeat protein [Bacteroidales bacterium]|nr:leucine-rich repeat protein [Bacteroidales bacterium]